MEAHCPCIMLCPKLRNCPTNYGEVVRSHFGKKDGAPCCLSVSGSKVGKFALLFSSTPEGDRAAEDRTRKGLDPTHKRSLSRMEELCDPSPKEEFGTPKSGEKSSKQENFRNIRRLYAYWREFLFDFSATGLICSLNISAPDNLPSSLKLENRACK